MSNKSLSELRGIEHWEEVESRFEELFLEEYRFVLAHSNANYQLGRLERPNTLVESLDIAADNFTGLIDRIKEKVRRSA